MAMRIDLPRHLRRRAAALAAVWVAALSGCATAPAGAPAAAAGLASQPAFLNADGAGPVDEGRWWTRWGDPMLDQRPSSTGPAPSALRNAGWLARLVAAAGGVAGAVAQPLSAATQTAASAAARRRR